MRQREFIARPGGLAMGYLTICSLPSLSSEVWVDICLLKVGQDAGGDFGSGDRSAEVKPLGLITIDAVKISHLVSRLDTLLDHLGRLREQVRRNR
jgi:hypothetical protein